MNKIYFIIVLFITLMLFNSCSSIDCDCLEELNTMNYTSEKYNKCIEIAILNKQTDPYNYFKRKCENKNSSVIADNLNNESEPKNIVEKTVPVKVKDLNKSETINLEDLNSIKKTSNKSMKDLLQGKWQHIDDKTNYLVFAGNHRKEIAEGMEKWDVEVFILSNKCANQSDKNNGLELEKDRYLSCPQSDLCWYIDKINDSRLDLIYLGRGNTLKYRKVIE